MVSLLAGGVSPAAARTSAGAPAFDPARRTRLWLCASSVGFAGLLTGCAAYGGKPLAPVSADLVQPAALEISKPDAIVEATGVCFHGWVCRDPNAGQTPRALRLERLDAAGAVVDAVYGRLTMTGSRMGRDCAAYDMPTDWPRAAAGNIRICASDTSQPCRPSEP